MKIVPTLVVVGSALEANPIRRIVTLLQNMQKECQEEGEREKGLYDKFMCFCKGNTDGLSSEITDNNAEAKRLDAEVKANTAAKAGIDGELADHKADRKEAKAALAKATAIRTKENAEYTKLTGDQQANIAALSKAITALEKNFGKSFLQTPANAEGLKRAVDAANSASAIEKETVMSFISQSGPYGDYNPASGEIVGILKEMKDEFDRDFNGAVSDEEAAQRNFDELQSAKTSEIKAASVAIEKKSVRSGELAVAITEARNGAKDARRQADANNEFLANLARDCETKTAEWEERSKIRNDEVLAISEAIKVLNDDDSLDIFKKTLPSPGVPSSFLQKSEDNRQSRRAQAYAWIQSAGSVSDGRHSQLNLLAYMLKVGKVDFSKVLKLIDDMVAHLGKEQKDDDSQRDWCNTEFENSDDKRKDLERSIRDATSAIDEADTKISAQKDSIAALQNKIAELDKAVAEATAQRKAENDEYVTNTAQLTAAKQLIDKAKNRLNKFYNPALYRPPPQRELTEEERIAQNLGEELPTEAPQYIEGTTITVNFLQTSGVSLVDAKPDPAPATWSGSYQKKGGKSGGVIALMDMLLKDCDTQMLEAKKDEETAQRDYEQLMSDSAKTRSTDAKSLADVEADKAATKTRHNDLSAERRARSDELSGTKDYIADLHSSCDFLLENYDFRKEARANERNALTNAKAVLNGASYSL